MFVDTTRDVEENFVGPFGLPVNVKCVGQASDSVTFSVLDYTPHPHCDRFVVSGDAFAVDPGGQLNTVAPLDHEGCDAYSVTVRATGNAPHLFDDAMVRFVAFGAPCLCSF